MARTAESGVRKRKSRAIGEIRLDRGDGPMRDVIARSLAGKDIVNQTYEIRRMIRESRSLGETCAIASAMLLGEHRLVAYYHFSPPSEMTGPDVVIVAPDFPDAWSRIYLHNELYRVDPVIHAARQASWPFYVDRGDPIAMSPEDRRHMDQLLDEMGAKTAVVVPLFGPMRRNGILLMLVDRPGMRFDDKELDGLSSVANALHLKICEQIAADRPKPELSPRETTVLAWIAKGKSASSIAEILGISSHTVEAHVRNLFLKLGVHDRVSAVLSGLDAGLVFQARLDP